MPTVPLQLPDGRTYDVDVSPLNCAAALQQPAPPSLQSTGATCILVPSPFRRALGIVIAAWGTAWLSIALIAQYYDWTILVLIGGGNGIAMVSIGLFLFIGAKKVVFDRRRAVVQITSGLTSEDYLMGKVITM